MSNDIKGVGGIAGGMGGISSGTGSIAAASGSKAAAPTCGPTGQGESHSGQAAGQSDKTSLSDEVRTELKLEEYMRLNGDSDELIASGRKSLSEELQKALKEHGAKTQE